MKAKTYKTKMVLAANVREATIQLLKVSRELDKSFWLLEAHLQE